MSTNGIDNHQTSRLEVLAAFKREYTATENFRKTIDPGYAQIMKTSELIESLTEEMGGTMLVAQSAIDQPVTVYLPNQDLEDALRKLADEDANLGIVKRIGDVLWSFYWPAAQGGHKYFPGDEAQWRSKLQDSKVDMSTIVIMNVQASRFYEMASEIDSAAAWSFGE